MAIFVPISQYIQIAQVSQFLSQADLASSNALSGGAINNNYTRLLRAVRRAVQWAYSRNPNDPTTQATAVYMYQLCGKYVGAAQRIINNQSIAAPVIVGPSNQSVNVNGNASFSVTATGATPLSYQWFDYLGNPIIGATSASYTFLNSKLADSGKTFFVKVTDVNGKTTTSNTAALTVTASIIASTWYGTSDPGPNLQAQIDNLTYQISTNITHNQPILITIPQAATPNMYFVTRVPIGETVKTIWSNTALNNGTIPDAIYQTVLQFNNFSYYYTRVQASMDYTQPLILT